LPRSSPWAEGAALRTRMAACPTTQVLKEFLDARLTAPAAQDVAGHVDACRSCQAVLEELSDDVALRPWKPCGPPPPAGPSAGPGLARVLEEAQFSSAPVDTPKLSAGALPPGDGTTLLGPPGRAGDLGSLGPYAVEAELGRGGMGVVYRG